jgi:hypothetical protein
VERGGGEGQRRGSGGTLSEKDGCCPPSYSSATQIFHGSTSSLFQTLKDKKEGCCYSAISTRDERGCWEGQGSGLVKFQIVLN